MDSSQAATFRLYAEVIVDKGFNIILDYGIPENLEFLAPGAGVKVYLNQRETYGIIYKIKNSTTCTRRVLPITDTIDSKISLPPHALKLLIWISQYYCASLSDTLALFLPVYAIKAIPTETSYKLFLNQNLETTKQIIKKLPKKSGKAKILEYLLQTETPPNQEEVLSKTKTRSQSIRSLEQMEAVRTIKIIEANVDHFESKLSYFPRPQPILNKEQKKAVDAITQSILSNQFHTHLLHGVTGSGKTEVYIRAIQEARKAHKNVLLLVPKTILIPPLIALLRPLFGQEVGSFHYKCKSSEKSQVWRDIWGKKIRILVGTGHALFCPMDDIGLIIIDEEHDLCYKHEQVPPYYHSRDVAIMRGKFAQATVILGSATPSLESYANALSKKYHLNTLTTQAVAKAPSKVSLIDMNSEYEKTKFKTLFSSYALQSIAKRLDQGEQTVIFFNRRGFHSNVSCSVCNHTLKCEHCEMILTFHKNSNQLLCHLCNKQFQGHPSQCPCCLHTMTLQYRGSGTEKIESILKNIFPSIRTIRIDSDTAKETQSNDLLSQQFASGKADVLIGTQMITKGTHFPNATLALVINSDSGLYIPDFRSSEHVFQLITQIMGRTGGAKLPCEIILQTFLPQNKTIVRAMKQDYHQFFLEEMIGRERCAYPPHCHLIRCIFSGKNDLQTHKDAQLVAAQLKQQRQEFFQILPVSPCGHFKIKHMFRYQFLIKSFRNTLHMQMELQSALAKSKISSQTRLIIDVDPISTFF